MNSAAVKISSLLVVLLIRNCVSSKALLICQYSGYCRVDSDCYPGNKCLVTNPQYSQCLPDTSQYSTKAGCLANNLIGIQCTDSTSCCDPGATCNNNPFRQCTQPLPSSLLCRDPLNFGNSTGFPMISPTASPSTQRPSNPTNSPSITQTSANTIQPVGTPSNAPKTTQSSEPSSNPSAKTSTVPASTPSGTPLLQSTNSPTVGPSSVISDAPIVKAIIGLPSANTVLICQYGGYCRSNADCIAGNKCEIKSQYFSQCVPDSTQYLTSNCLPNNGAKCSDSTTCCDPGAVCNHNAFRQCTQPTSPNCTIPSSYNAVAATPSNAPVVSTTTGTPESAAPIILQSTLPTVAPVSVVSTSAPATKAVFGALICQYGGYCRSNADCVSGNKCDIKGQYFSQCVPDSTQYLTSNCLPNNGAKCSDSTTCCDPGAVCNHNAFRQCTQPTSPNCTIPSSYNAVAATPSNAPVVSTLPTVAPVSVVSTSAPATKAVFGALICQFGGYCRSNADCVSGNKCDIKGQYFSQCVPDITQYLTTNCIANYGAKCSDSTTCCDPGAVCNHNVFRQCTQPTFPNCTIPSSYSAAPATPSAVPVSTSTINPSSVPTTAPANTVSTKSPVVSIGSGRICQFGGYCRSNADCVSGNKCEIKNPYYSQCVADSTQYLTANCLSNYGARCSDSTTCCDPGAICNNNAFRQCSQPNYPDCTFPSGYAVNTSTAVPSTVPSVVPSPASVSSPLICQYGGYCSTDSDCVAGNKCNVQNSYYSQCVPDTSKYATVNCLSNYGPQCSDTTVCCDPGATCNQNKFRQCTQPVFPDCATPTSFGKLTAAPTTSAPTVVPGSVKICQYCGYCRSNSDCVSGNKCAFLNPYYSQCLPDVTQYSNDTTCVANYGSQCSSTTKCCDPGALCSSSQYRQCKPLVSPFCSCPTGFSSSSIPSVAPTVAASAIRFQLSVPVSNVSCVAFNTAAQEAFVVAMANTLQLQSSNVVFISCSDSQQGVIIRVNITAPLQSNTVSEANNIYNQLVAQFNTAALNGQFTSELRSAALQKGATTIAFALVSETGVATPFVFVFFDPTLQPTFKPSSTPTEVPSSQPNAPISSPTEQPSSAPIATPTETPSTAPIATPTETPSTAPVTNPPSTAPIATPTERPSTAPVTGSPSLEPIATPTETPSSEPVTDAPVLLKTDNPYICLYGDCSDSSDCVPGTVCVTQRYGYKTCLEEAKYTTLSETCHTTADYGCGGARGATGCCNPHAVCNSAHMCTLPNECVMKVGDKNQIKTPIQSPTSIPSIPSHPTAGKDVICLFGDCTKSNSVCVYGAYCKQQNPYFKQCVEDPAFTNISSSCHVSNYDYGCGGASGAVGCCNPGATCNAKHICTLSRKCVFQSSTGSSPTSSPIVSSAGRISQVPSSALAR